MTHEQAITTKWTGTIYGPVTWDDAGKPWQTIWEYQHGFCTDSYITAAPTRTCTQCALPFIAQGTLCPTCRRTANAR